MNTTPKMAYIPDKYKVTKEQFDEIYKNLGENDATWETLLMVDYVFHHQDADYNGGLSFLERLHKKLGKFHPEWDLDEYFNLVEGCKYDSVEQFILIVQDMLADPSDVAYYGV